MSNVPALVSRNCILDCVNAQEKTAQAPAHAVSLTVETSPTDGGKLAVVSEELLQTHNFPQLQSGINLAQRVGVDLRLIACEVNTMYEAPLLQSTERLSNSAFIGGGGEIWNSLQNLKEQVSQELLTQDPFCQSEPVGLRNDIQLEANASDIEWFHRAQLETRLREITDAQDRLLDGTYGRCVECKKKIPTGRLTADPAVSLCLQCQQLHDGQHRFSTL